MQENFCQILWAVGFVFHREEPSMPRGRSWGNWWEFQKQLAKVRHGSLLFLHVCAGNKDMAWTAGRFLEFCMITRQQFLHFTPCVLRCGHLSRAWFNAWKKCALVLKVADNHGLAGTAQLLPPRICSISGHSTWSFCKLNRARDTGICLKLSQNTGSSISVSSELPGSSAAGIQTSLFQLYLKMLGPKPSRT